MFKFSPLTNSTFLFILIFSISFNANSSNTTTATEAELKKSHLEDIFIWKMSDELKLTANEEKQFTDIHRALNKKKSELNKKIQESIQSLKEKDGEAALKAYKKLIQDYNQLSITEFDSIKNLLGAKKFISYIKIKNELTSKVKSILIGERMADNKKEKDLPPPKVIIEKGE